MADDATRLDYRDPEWVAEQLGIDKNTVYKYLQEGSLPGLQLGRKWLVSERRLADFLERVEREQTARRRDATTGAHRPFGLPERARLHDDDHDGPPKTAPSEKGDS
jgi:excisionase family DNA binding protein